MSATEADGLDKCKTFTTFFSQRSSGCRQLLGCHPLNFAFGTHVWGGNHQNDCTQTLASKQHRNFNTQFFYNSNLQPREVQNS